MEFSHYPRQPGNIVFSAVYPVPPDRPNFKTLPALSESNLVKFGMTLKEGTELVGRAQAIDLSTFMGSLASDATIACGIYFSNDEVDPEGNFIIDASLPLVHWDVVEKEWVYEPGKSPQKMIYILTGGRWIKVSLKFKTRPTFVRFYLRGKTF